MAQQTVPKTKTTQERFADYVKYIQQTHKAPFDRDAAVLPPNGAAAILKGVRDRAAQGMNVPGGNVKVNQDRNPWPKAEIGAAVDPTNGNNYVVMSNDFRENWDEMFYHVSTDGGRSWTDDAMVGGNDPVTGDIPLTFESDPGVAFDTVGHSFVSTITGNEIFDSTNFYENFDTQIIVAPGFAHGTYTYLVPTPIDFVPCYGTSTTSNCPGSLDKPLITVDTQPNSRSKGTVYVYYTYFCNADPCTDGSVTIPPFSSVILESHSPGWGLPFSAPHLVSGVYSQEQFSSRLLKKLRLMRIPPSV